MGVIRNHQITCGHEFESSCLGGTRIGFQCPHVELVSVASYTFVWECECFRKYDGASIQ